MPARTTIPRHVTSDRTTMPRPVGSDRTTMPRPVVGLVGSQYVVPRFWGELQVSGAPTSYVDAVLAAGGTPIVLAGRCAAASLDVVDALVLTGGGDVDPTRYGGDPKSSRDVNPVRDNAEFELVLAAAAARVPLLGVCRGLQVMVVAFGGTLTPDLGMAHVRPNGHPISTTPESLLARLLGPRSDVTSIHHQAVADPGDHWKVTAIADDGVGEAIEWTGAHPWPALGVQWHPELNDPTGPALFSWLVEQGRSIGGPRRSGSSRPKRHRY
ncbi:gamma-glutamyl-gamma-aminobutyrate hydrolase family protein [Kribbella sp. NBC_01245]|uniref:gamma-glutamyl-gamma-aminobutyrate hydrolase family protein n=1 Tax=Kribbella sp. NBC_01245 TaxID=2903578 RepID=UPI002E29DC33|nr:gamma-glutamyl-gamma-aminobutyrate hydrolase family protein [Kribbella sp. NBC_01245]